MLLLGCVHGAGSGGCCLGLEALLLGVACCCCWATGITFCWPLQAGSAWLLVCLQSQSSGAIQQVAEGLVNSVAFRG